MTRPGQSGKYDSHAVHVRVLKYFSHLAGASSPFSPRCPECGADSTGGLCTDCRRSLR